MLDALAITLGLGWVVARDVDVAALPALIGVVFLVAFAIGKIRYR